MKPVPLAIGALLLCVTSVASSPSKAPDAPQPPAERTFARLKTLAGSWKGQAAMGAMGSAPARVSLRVVPGGPAILHEMVPEGRSDDSTRGDDDPITMLYVDGDRLMLTHYCDSGKNRPRMAGKESPDGRSVVFDFLDVSGGSA